MVGNVANYSIIRYVNNIPRGEFVNIGIILHDGSDIHYKITESTTRILDFFYGCYDAKIEALLFYTSEKLKNVKELKTMEYFDIIKPSDYAIQYSNNRVIMIENTVEETLNQLYHEYIL
jgi:hypothetical protein